MPNGACLDSERERLFVVNKGSNLITEYRTSDLSSVRDIAWDGTDSGPTDTHFEIHCSPDRLYVVDGAWAPGLFTVEGLDATSPIVNNHSEHVAGVGGLVLNEGKHESLLLVPVRLERRGLSTPAFIGYRRPI